MSIIQQGLFVLVLAGFGWLLFKRVKLISKLISLGKTSSKEVNKSEALSRTLLFAFGQKRMFEKPLVGILHFFIYAGFLLINLEVLEIVLDGVLGTHRVLAPFLGGLYPVLIGFFEFMAVAVLISCLVFLVRRNILKLDRFQSTEMTSWPKLDANLILIIEIVLVSAILFLGAADQSLQVLGSTGYTSTGPFYFSSFLMPVFSGAEEASIIIVERGLWWGHIIGILFFAVYVTYSKHLHIFLAFPNTYYSGSEPSGKIQNMPEITSEVQLMMGLSSEQQGNPPESFGAKDVFDLSRKSLMGAFSCTECGRCTEECPANQTGKKLSPRKIMMDTRDRLEEIGRNGKFERDEKTLIRDYISEEEILACTSCQACVQACPVQINPLEIILELRRYLVMEESKTPQEWTAMMTNIENNFAPWAFPSADRFKWANEFNKEQE